MKTIADKVAEQTGQFTIRCRFTSTRKTAEYIVLETLADGFLGQPLGRSRGEELVRYAALDYVRVLNAGDS
jgi:hypothetical protein